MAGLNDFACSSGHLQPGERIQLIPGGLARIVSGPEIAASDCTVKIDQHVMIFASAGGVRHDALENGCNSSGRDMQAGLFEDLAYESVFQAFPGFHKAARQGPIAGERFLSTLD